MNIPWREKNKAQFIWVLLLLSHQDIQTLHSILHCCSHPNTPCPKYFTSWTIKQMARETSFPAYLLIHTHKHSSIQQKHLNKKSPRVHWQEPMRHIAAVPFYDTTSHNSILCLSVASWLSSWPMCLIMENRATSKTPNCLYNSSSQNWLLQDLGGKVFNPPPKYSLSKTLWQMLYTQATEYGILSDYNVPLFELWNGGHHHYLWMDRTG